MKAILTRPGPNSKTVISGDVTQKDNTGFHPNYLEIVAERFIDRGHGGYVQFNKNDIVRSTKTRAVIETLDELHEELERALLLKSNQSQLRITK